MRRSDKARELLRLENDKAIRECLLDACKMALVQVKEDNDERKAEYRGTEQQLRAVIATAEKR